jgi:hypothetical protein
MPHLANSAREPTSHVIWSVVPENEVGDLHRGKGSLKPVGILGARPPVHVVEMFLVPWHNAELEK